MSEFVSAKVSPGVAIVPNWLFWLIIWWAAWFAAFLSFYQHDYRVKKGKFVFEPMMLFCMFLISGFLPIPIAMSVFKKLRKDK